MSCYGSGVVVRHLERIIFGSIVCKVGLNGGGTVRAGFSVAASTRVRRRFSISIQQVRKQLKGNQNQISDLAAIRDAVYKTADTVPPADSELLLTVQRRSRVLEVSVGTDAPCVRNIASPKTRQSCVHRIDQAKLHYTVCGWQYNSAAHVRLASDDANRLPESQLCEMCWHAGNSDTHSDSSSSSSSCSSSSSSSNKTLLSGQASESVMSSRCGTRRVG